MNTQALTVAEQIFEPIREFIQERVLEIESGKGELSSLLMENGIAVHLSDLDRNNRETLREKFKENAMLRGVHKINLDKFDFGKSYPTDLDKFNTVLKLNTSRTAPQGQLTVSNAQLLLKQYGHLILQAPAYTTTFNNDEMDGDKLQKFNWRYIKDLLGPGLDILKTHFFNLPIIPDSSSSTQSGLSVIVVARKK